MDVAVVNGMIGPVSSEFIEESLSSAREAGADLLIIQLDTPGGLLGTTRELVKLLLGSRLPIAVYVAPSGSRAGSAGVFITMAAHIAAMAPGTNIGAAHPVSIGFGGSGEDSSSVMGDKILNDTSAFIKTIAGQRERNVAWADSAVRHSVSITENEALERGVIDLIAGSVEALVDSLDGRTIKLSAADSLRLELAGAEIVYHRFNWRYNLLDRLSDPNIAYILFLVGLVGLYFELSNPGLIFPGVVGGISLILAFFAFQTLPINYAGILLILFAIVLFIVEVKIPSFGLLTLGGIISML
ncbi:MAG: serine protease, partial [Candidatus Glassbacteria bacterium GWA2_58_10]